MTKVKILSIELFYVLTGALLVFLILELAWPRLVLAYIKLNLVLILWFINVIVLLLLTKEKDDK